MRIPFFFVGLFISIAVCGFNASAQECGVGFAQFSISNALGKRISNSTIEIIGSLPYDSDDPAGLIKVRKEEQWLKYLETRQGLPAYIIPPKFLKDVLDQKLELSNKTDDCGNPWKQQAGIKNIKTINYFFVNKKEKNFGYCTGETRRTPYILKISAKGYADSYFVGGFLGGCSRRYDFVLNNRNRRKIKKRLKTPALKKSKSLKLKQ
ncbi:MAG TPA: hypothetical protein PKY59_09470 [Pyrinomonadaceae bacterium]|nr:hypothetical protein [Pyrinomonadaceae bacterium]